MYGYALMDVSKQSLLGRFLLDCVDSFPRHGRTRHDALSKILVWNALAPAVHGGCADAAFDRLGEGSDAYLLDVVGKVHVPDTTQVV